MPSPSPAARAITAYSHTGLLLLPSGRGGAGTTSREGTVLWMDSAGAGGGGLGGGAAAAAPAGAGGDGLGGEGAREQDAWEDIHIDPSCAH